MMKTLLKTFVALLAIAAATGPARAQQAETLLTTILSTSPNDNFTSGSQTFDGVATITFSSVVINDGNDWGWYSYSPETMTVTAAEGYTITRVRFYCRQSSAFDLEAPFEATMMHDDDWDEEIVSVNGTIIGGIGVTQIEVYGYSNAYEITCTAQTDSRDEIGTGLPMGVVTLGGRHLHFLDDTLTATANYGYIFSGWYAADTLVSEDNPYIFSPVENSAYEARFVPDTFTINTVTNIETAAELTGAGRYAYLTGVTLTATPATGYHFINWTNNAGTELCSGTTYTLQVLGDSTIIAVLDTNVYTVTANVNIEGLGTVTGAGQVKHFMSTTLMAAAHVKYHFVNWINDAGDEVGSSAGLIVYPVSDTTLTAVFDTNIYATVWSGNDTTTYTSHPYTGLTATYTDFWGNSHTPTLTFVCGNQTIVTPDYPVTAGTWTVTAVGDEGDSLTLTDTTLVINRAIVSIVGFEIQIAKFADGTDDAVVASPGSIYNVQGSDVMSHTTVAHFNNANPGIHKSIVVDHAIFSDDPAVLDNYTLSPVSEIYTTEGTIIETITPDTNISGDDTTLVNNGIELYAYGYCTGSSYQIKYHLNNGQPDQYKIDFADSRFTDVPWTSLTTTGLNGTIDINVPVDIPTGDYTCTLTFGDSRFAWLESAPITLVFHVNLPETFTMPLFNNVIALVDTCQCFTDIQWYHRPDANSEWYAIPGATGYYYHATDAELNGEFFVKAKYNGVETYTCPQTDMETLLSDTEDEVNVKAYPNPTTDDITLTVSGSTQFEHTLRVISTVGAEMENRTFEGPSTTIDMRNYRTGIYMVSVDGVVVRVIRN